MQRPRIAALRRLPGGVHLTDVVDLLPPVVRLHLLEGHCVYFIEAVQFPVDAGSHDDGAIAGPPSGRPYICSRR